MIPGSLNTMILSGRLPPDFLELVGTPKVSGASSSSSTITVPLPAHQIGDLLVVTIQVATGFGSGYGEAPEGWTRIAIQIYSGEGNSVGMYSKIAESSAETFETSIRTSPETTRAWMGFVFRSKTGRVPKIEVVVSGNEDVAAYSGFTWPVLTPSAGVQKYSFLLGWFGKRTANLPRSPTFPSGYSKIAQVAPVGATGRHIRSEMGYRNLETDTTSPGSMIGAGVGFSVHLVYIAAVIWEE